MLALACLMLLTGCGTFEVELNEWDRDRVDLMNLHLETVREELAGLRVSTDEAGAHFERIYKLIREFLPEDQR